MYGPSSDLLPSRDTTPRLEDIMDPHVYDMLVELRQEELEREVALRRLARELRASRRALRDAGAGPEPSTPTEPRRRPAVAPLHRPRPA
ncbi:hypothetical protein JCM11754A_25080 [Isoptericola variabilis]